MFTKINAFITYLFGKSSELGDLDTKDAVLAKVVLDIHRKRTHTSFVMVPLFSLVPIHGIDRENALASVRKRVETLHLVRDDLIQEHTLSRETLHKHIPSVSGIKVVRQSDHAYIAFEGNGRLYALHEVFAPEDQLQVEVEEYHFTNRQKILRRMNRVRRMNGLAE